MISELKAMDQQNYVMSVIAIKVYKVIKKLIAKMDFQ